MIERAQVSIEFIMVIVILLVFISTVIFPFASNAINSVNDVIIASQSTNSFDELVKEINLMQFNLIGDVKTIELFLPKNSTITCDELNQKIILEFNLLTPSKTCNNSINCKKEKNELPITCQTKTIIGKDLSYSIKISKESNAILIKCLNC